MLVLNLFKYFKIKINLVVTCRYLVVTKSVDNRRLWVNGIPKSKSTEEIR